MSDMEMMKFEHLGDTTILENQDWSIALIYNPHEDTLVMVWYDRTRMLNWLWGIASGPVLWYNSSSDVSQ